MHCFRLDEIRSARVPACQSAGAVRIGLHGTFPHDPGDLDILRMGRHHAAMGGCMFGKTEEEPVVYIGQAQALALTAPVVHEDLQRRRAVFHDVIRD